MGNCCITYDDIDYEGVIIRPIADGYYQYNGAPYIPSQISRIAPFTNR